MGGGINVILQFGLAFFQLLPLAARAIMLDAKLDPDEGEDETRIITGPEMTRRTERSLYRRWFRAANYQRENIDRAVEGLPVDNCPRLTRAKRNLWKSINEKSDVAAGSKRKAAWREDDDNRQHELDKQAAVRAVRADAEYLANVMINDGHGGVIECERPIIAADGEGMDDDDDFIMRDGVKWPEHHTILLGAGGVGFKDGKVVDLPMSWVGHDDKRPLTGIEAIEFYLSLPERYGPTCSIVMFSFNYDVTMLLKGLRKQRSNSYVKVGGMDFKAKGNVTLPTLSHRFPDVRDVAVEFETAFIPDGDGVHVAQVLDLTTGERRR
jgi:hypothetical protein